MEQPRKKKKRKKKRYLLKFTILVLLAVGAYFFLTSEIFDIQQIEVENNSYYTAEQIIDLAGAETGNNLFETKTTDLRDKLLKDPYVKSAKVSRKLPATLVITVEERKEYAAVVEENVVIPQELLEPQPDVLAPVDGQAQDGTDGQAQDGTDGQPQPDAGIGSATDSAAGITDPSAVPADSAVPEDGAASALGAVDPNAGATQGGVDANGTAIVPQTTPQVPVVGTLYVLLDKDGLVLRSTTVAPGLPLISGLTVKTAKAGKPIKVEENLMLSDTLNMIGKMNESDLFFKRIVVTPVLVKAYVYDTLICEGEPVDIADNMEGLKEVLANLYTDGTQRGVIRVVSDSGTTPFTFSPLIE